MVYVIFRLAQRARRGNAKAFADHLHPTHGHLGIVPIQPVAAAPVPVAGMQVVGKGIRIAKPSTLRKPKNHINQSCLR